MEIDKLAQVVEDMIVQLDYPGFEPRALKLGLPETVNKLSPKVFLEALGHPSVFVKLAALRWFQSKPGMGKGREKAIAGLLAHEDPFVRMESIRALEKLSVQQEELVIAIAALLHDQNADVKKAAAKALGKLCAKRSKKIDSVIDELRAAAEDSDPEVRWKVQKALRLLGEYAS